MSMKDQADTLRRLMQQRERESGATVRREAPGAPVMTFASGKGGVGKSCLVANLGALLARTGKRVLVVDGDTGLANLDILLGCAGNARPEVTHAQATLEHVLRGEATLQQVVVGVEPNLWLLPSSSGFMGARGELSPAQRLRAAQVLEACPWEMDVILVDVGAGIQENVVSLHAPSQESVVVMTPEPTSLADAYGLIKVLRRDARVNRVNVIVNQVTDGRDGVVAFQKLKEVAGKFLDVEVEYLGHWQRDEKISQSVMKRKILLDLDPGAASIPSLELLSKRIMQDRLGMSEDGRGQLLRSATRFTEETARMAPGNTAGFFRTLLGEVNA